MTARTRFVICFYAYPIMPCLYVQSHILAVIRLQRTLFLVLIYLECPVLAFSGQMWGYFWECVATYPIPQSQCLCGVQAICHTCFYKIRVPTHFQTYFGLFLPIINVYPYGFSASLKMPKNRCSESPCFRGF